MRSEPKPTTTKKTDIKRLITSFRICMQFIEMGNYLNNFFSHSHSCKQKHNVIFILLNSIIFHQMCNKRCSCFFLHKCGISRTRFIYCIHQSKQLENTASNFSSIFLFKKNMLMNGDCG